MSAGTMENGTEDVSAGRGEILIVSHDRSLCMPFWGSKT